MYPDNDEPKHPEQGDAPLQDAPAAPIFQPDTATPQGGEETENAQQNRPPRADGWGNLTTHGRSVFRRISRTNAIIAVATVVNAIVAACQFTAISDQLAQTSEHIRISERPWLTDNAITDEEMSKNVVLKPDIKTRFRLGIKNTGRSPALNVRAYGCILIRTIDNVPATGQCPPSTYAGQDVIAVDGEYYVSTIPAEIPSEALLRLQDGKSLLWAFWGATYKDQFGNNYRSDFCQVFSSRDVRWSYCQGVQTRVE